MPKGYRADGTPNGTGYQHGGPGLTAAQVKKMQETYAEARVLGATPMEAKRLAGYSEKTEQTSLEVRGDGPFGPAQKIRDSLKKHNIDFDYLAKEYLDGIKASKEFGAKEAAFSAHAQYLKQLGFILGIQRDKQPSVAVQINNQQSSPRQFDVDRVKAIVELLEDEVARRESGKVHDGNPGTPSPQAHQGMVSPPTDEKATGDRGQP